jgi:hypothetical protein
LVGALGFFRTGEPAVVRSPAARHDSSLANLKEALGVGAAPGPLRPDARTGVTLTMKDGGDRIDREFERF